jgi:hypothetical protein
MRHLSNGTRSPIVVPSPPPYYVRCAKCRRVFAGLGRAVGWQCSTEKCPGKASDLRPATKLEFVGQDET